MKTAHSDYPISRENNKEFASQMISIFRDEILKSLLEAHSAPNYFASPSPPTREENILLFMHIVDIPMAVIYFQKAEQVN